MALKGGSKYCNTNVPASGVSSTLVCTTSIPVPTSSEANEVVRLDSGPVTLALSGAATSNTYRLFILPANHIVTDAWVDTTTTAAAGKVTLCLLATGSATNDGGTAGTLDAAVSNSSFSAEIAVATAVRNRIGIPIPAVTTTAATRAASPGVAVPYDRVIGMGTTTAITTNDAVVNVVVDIAAV